MITCVHAFGERAVSRKYEMCMRVKGRSGIYNGSRESGKYESCEGRETEVD